MTGRGAQVAPAYAIPLLEELIEDHGSPRAYELMAGLYALGIGKEQDLRRAVRIYSALVEHYQAQGDTRTASDMATRAKSARDALKDGRINTWRHRPESYFKPLRDQTIQVARRNAETMHGQ